MATPYEIAADFGATLASGNDFLKNFQGQSPAEHLTAATSLLATVNSAKAGFESLTLGGNSLGTQVFG